jgi:hypothetical protein
MKFKIKIINPFSGTIGFWNHVLYNPQKIYYIGDNKLIPYDNEKSIEIIKEIRIGFSIFRLLLYPKHIFVFKYHPNSKIFNENI